MFKAKVPAAYVQKIPTLGGKLDSRSRTKPITSNHFFLKFKSGETVY